MDLETFHQTLSRPEARGHELNDEQRQSVDYGGGPLWLLAGPGSGKSEVLVTRTLRLLCVETQVPPRSIFVTTFTEKAARNLEDRLASYLSVLQATDPTLRTVDLADMRIGTLHSLCNDIMQEYRYPAYQNVRLLNDVDQHLFAYKYASIANLTHVGFWASFRHAIPIWSPDNAKAPSKWKRVKAAVVLFNHIVEDMVDVNLMSAAGGHWAILAQHYQQYSQALQQQHRCDFAHLQARFLDFVTSPAGNRFLHGDGQRHLPLHHILIDEYQDTNPIQERIYLALAAAAPHNITVTGDDDQALYRFRGGNVACMVNFDQACQVEFGQSAHPIPLYKNYRSHEGIVTFFNEYITSFPEMNVTGVRAANKLPVDAESSISGNYPTVSWLARNQERDLGDGVAELIQDHLQADNIIQDLSQCVLLLRSTKDSPNNAGKYLAALAQRGIPVYNPRSKAFMESEEVQCLLAALIEITDQNHTFDLHYKDQNGNDLPFVGEIHSWFVTLDAARSRIDPTALDNYLTQSKAALPNLCAARPGQLLNLTLLEVAYRLLSLEPFRTWRNDPVRNLRLSKVTRLFESYHSLGLDQLASDQTVADIPQWFRNRFYHMFISYLVETGIDDDEDEEVIVPHGYLPVMTIHQSKGLEFPIVLVGHLGQKSTPGTSQRLENDLAPFRQDLYPRTIRTSELLALEDDIRLLYVAYSRAQHALILVGTRQHITNHVAAPRRDAVAFRRNTPAI